MILKLKVTGTLGQGPDVLVELNGVGLLLHEEPVARHGHGIVKQGSLDLTRDQAKDLATELIRVVAIHDVLISKVSTDD